MKVDNESTINAMAAVKRVLNVFATGQRVGATKLVPRNPTLQWLGPSQPLLPLKADGFFSLVCICVAASCSWSSADNSKVIPLKMEFHFPSFNFLTTPEGGCRSKHSSTCQEMTDQ